MSSVPDPATPITAIPAILLAVRAMKPSSIVSVLDEAATRHGLDATIDEVVFPALRVVGTFWASGTLDIAHEHLLSSAVTRWVYAQLQHQRVHRRGRVLLAAGPHDLHVLGLDCFELLLASRGVEVANLGAQIPIESLVLAARSADASAVVVCSHNPTATTPAGRAVRAVSAAGFHVYYAGSSFDSQFMRQHTPGHALDAPLGVSADLITRLHTAGAADTGSSPVRSAAQLTA